MLLIIFLLMMMTAAIAMSGFHGRFFAESTNYYYLPISTAVDIGSSNDMSPAKEVHRRLGHP